MQLQNSITLLLTSPVETRNRDWAWNCSDDWSDSLPS